MQHVGKHLQVKNNKRTVFSAYGNRKKHISTNVKSSERLRRHANTIKYQSNQVYTKCSGNETLAAGLFSNRDLAADKKVEISGVIVGGVP